MGFAVSHAAATKHAVITMEEMRGAMKKYLQLRIVTTPKQMASPQTVPRMRAKAMRGMAERAEKIGAKFSWTSSAGKGTDVQVIVPARRAYARTNGSRLFS